MCSGCNGLVCKTESSPCAKVEDKTLLTLVCIEAEVSVSFYVSYYTH